MEFSDKEETLISIFLNTARPQNDDTAIHFLQVFFFIFAFDSLFHFYCSFFDFELLLLSVNN